VTVALYVRYGSVPIVTVLPPGSRPVISHSCPWSAQVRRLTESLGQPPILLIARLERPRREGQPLDIEDLGIAADLEYHTGTLALLDRTQPTEVDVLIVKDRSGPAPLRLTVPW